MIEELLAANDRAVGQWRQCRQVPGEGIFCFITVNGVSHHEQVLNRRRDRQAYVDRLNAVTQTEIIDPAREIAAKWGMLD